MSTLFAPGRDEHDEGSIAYRCEICDTVSKAWPTVTCSGCNRGCKHCLTAGFMDYCDICDAPICKDCWRNNWLNGFKLCLKVACKDAAKADQEQARALAESVERKKHPTRRAS